MAVFNPTGGKYAIATLSAAGTSTVAVSAATFVSGDFGAKQRMVALYTSANAFKGIAWVRRFVSTTQLELENQFVDPITGLFATQAVGDKMLVSKNLSEIVVTGIAWDATTRIATMTAAMNVGTANDETSACIYDENATITMTDAIQITGGVVAFGKLISYDGLTRESMIWNRDVWLNPLSTFQGAGAGTYNYTMLRPNGPGGHFFMFGGNIGGSYQSSNFMGIVGAGTGGKSFGFFGTRQNYACTSPSNGQTWGVNAARHLLYNCLFEATYGNADLVMWGNGTWIGGNITFPQYQSGPLGAFRGNGTSNYAAPSGKRALVQDLGQGALIDGISTSTYNFTNLITPAVNSVRTGSAGASTIVATFSYQDDYTNVQPRTTIVVRRTVDSVVSTSVVNTADATFTAKVLQSSYTSTTTGNLTQTANYTSFDWTAKCYGYAVLNGNYAVVNYSLGTGGTGKNVTLGGLLNQLADEGVTLTEANALALSSKFTVNSSTKVITVTASATYDELYDYTVAWGCSSAANAQVPTLTRYLFATSGTSMSCYTGWTMVVNTGVTLAEGAKFTSISVPTVTLNGSGKITGLYETSAGPSSIVEITASEGSSVYIGNASTGITKLFQSGVTAGSYRLYLAPGDNTPVSRVRELYGFQRAADTITPTGGLYSFNPVDIPDVGITQSNVATVNAYTTIDTPSKFYDRTAAFRLTEQGIKLGQIATRSGTSIEHGTFSKVIRADAAAVYAIVGSTITIKAASYEADSKYTKEIATPPATITAYGSEIVTISIEDANGDSRAVVAGTVNSLVDVWKITNSTPVADFATGTKIGSNIGNGAFRWIAVDGFKLVFNNKDNGVYRYCSMSKGDYTVGWYLYDVPTGGLTQEQSNVLNSLDTKNDAIFGEINSLMTGFVESTDSLHALRQAVDTKPTLADITASTLNANIVQVNDVPVSGTGAEGDEWGPSA